MDAVYWIRNDLRINDNIALEMFFEKCSDGLAVWCPDKSFQRARENRLKFIKDNLKSHSVNLRTLGIEFNIEDDYFYEFLVKHHKKNKIKELYFTKMYSFDEITEENRVKEFCSANQIKVFQFDQCTLIEEKNLPFSLIEMPVVFTDFRKKCEAKLVINKPSNKFLNIKLENTIQGEEQARSRLYDYIWETKSILNYKETRNGMIKFNDSTKLSPWLSVGAVSSRNIFNEISLFEKKLGANESTYWLFFELLWRDYFKFLSKKSGSSFFRINGINKTTNRIHKTHFDKKLFANWCNGQTSEPFVNANMKELNATGFMSNRGRQNVASYLIHDLNLPWTWGAKYFEELLIDYDPDSNWGNWLYLSGNGTDPRSRIFNIKKQAQDYDPLGLYQKKWNVI